MLRFGLGGGGEDDVEKVGRTSGKTLATPPAKARKNNRRLEKRRYHLSGVVLSRKRWLRIILDGMKSSRSFQRKKEWRQWQEVVLWNATQSLPFAIFRRLDLRRCSGCCYVLQCGYLTIPIYGNTMLRNEQQPFAILFCTLKSDFIDVKRFEF